MVDELNRSLLLGRGIVMTLWRWETDAYSTLHLDGPQGALDELMRIEAGGPRHRRVLDALRQPDDG